MALAQGMLDYFTQLVYGQVRATQPNSALLSQNMVAGVELSLIQGRLNAYQHYQSYYDGFHHDISQLPITADHPDTSHGGLTFTAGEFFPGRHNFLDVVVDVVTERLQVTGVECSGEFTAGLSDDAATQMAADLAARLMSWWTLNRMDLHQRTVHTQAQVKADGYVVADWDAARGIPRFTFNDASMITPVYDANHQILVAYKVWSEVYFDDGGVPRARQRLTKYYPALIEKWAQDGTTWQPWPHDLGPNGEPDGGRIEWTDIDGRALGIPIVHFKNRPLGADFGTSDLHDLIPIQDEYNRRVLSTSEGIGFSGNTQKYATNARLPEDKDGVPQALVSSPGSVWALAALDPEKPVDIGQLAPTDVAALQEVADRELKTLAAKSRTPMHLLWPEGALPSGEALKSAEAGLVAKCREKALVFGSAWEDLFQLAIRLNNTFGVDLLPETVTLSVQWAPFESRSAMTDEAVILSRRADISWREAMRERGFDEDTINRIEVERELEAADAAAAAQQQADALTLAAAQGMNQPAAEMPAVIGG